MGTGMGTGSHYGKRETAHRRKMQGSKPEVRQSSWAASGMDSVRNTHNKIKVQKGHINSLGTGIWFPPPRPRGSFSE